MYLESMGIHSFIVMVARMFRNLIQTNKQTSGEDGTTEAGAGGGCACGGGQVKGTNAKELGSTCAAGDGATAGGAFVRWTGRAVNTGRTMGGGGKLGRPAFPNCPGAGNIAPE